MKLYELSAEFRTIQALLEEGGCDQAELEGRLATLQGDIVQKVDSLAAVHAHLVRHAEAAKGEKDRLAEREAHYWREAERLQRWLQQFLEETGTQKVTGSRFTVSLRKCNPSVRVLDEQAIPDVFFRVVPESREVDKRGILDFFKVGGEIPPGVDVVTDKKTLSIR